MFRDFAGEELCREMFPDGVGRDRIVGGVINAFAVFNEQYLRTFVLYAIHRGNAIGYVAVFQQVEKEKGDFAGPDIPAAFQAVFGHSADGAARGMLENQNTVDLLGERQCLNVFQLMLVPKVLQFQRRKIRINSSSHPEPDHGCGKQDSPDRFYKRIEPNLQRGSTVRRWRLFSFSTILYIVCELQIYMLELYAQNAPLQILLTM